MLVNELKESRLKALLGSGFNSEAETFVVSLILPQVFGCLVVHASSVLFSREGVLEGWTEILNSQIFQEKPTVFFDRGRKGNNRCIQE